MNKDFDRLVARASDPNLIPGIYNYCDRRCARCPFNERCLSFLDNRDLEAQHGPLDDVPLPATIERSLERTIEFIREVAKRDGFDLAGAACADGVPDMDSDRHRNDLLAVRAREYAAMARPVMQAVEPILARRGDAELTDAAETIAWFSTFLNPKICRAIASRADGWNDADDVQCDANGSAKVARLGITESRRAWHVLMTAGKATADGVPARAVQMLDDLDRQVAERFPLAMEFVRPGFDEPAVAAGALTDLPPFAPRSP